MKAPMQKPVDNFLEKDLFYRFMEKNKTFFGAKKIAGKNHFLGLFSLMRPIFLVLFL
jgi:hypothetical protein